MTDRFPNPEVGWHLENSAKVNRDEVIRRVGLVKGEIVRLSGGLANDSYRIGKQLVLRIYRRDVRSLTRERALLARDWQSFRVPQILDEGEDFLVLECVAHEPLANSEAQGAAVGRALAEIHEQKFACGGLFGDAIEVEQPWSDFPRKINEYIESQVTAVPDLAEVLARTAHWLAARQKHLQEDCANAVLLHGDFKASNLHWADDDRLLVLDWEFAYAGPALMDIGQLVRWGIPEPFRRGFARAYSENGGNLLHSWEAQARCFDLVNLVGLSAKSRRGSKQAIDCRRRIEQTIASAD